MYFKKGKIRKEVSAKKWSIPKIMKPFLRRRNVNIVIIKEKEKSLIPLLINL